MKTVKKSHFPTLSSQPALSSSESLRSFESRLKGKTLPIPFDGQISMSAVFSTALYKKDFPLDSCACIQNTQIGLTFRQLDEMSRRVARIIGSKIAKILPGHKEAPTNPDGDSIIAILTSGHMIEEQTLVFILAILKLGATFVNIQPGMMNREGDWKRMIKKVNPLMIIVADEDQQQMAEIISGTNTTASCTLVTDSGKHRVKLPQQVLTASFVWKEALKLSQEESHDAHVTPLVSKVPVGNRTAGVFPCFLPGNEVHWIRVAHRAIHNRIYWEKTEFPIHDFEKFYLTFPFSDPRSLVQLFLPLCVGRPIRLLSSDIFYSSDNLLEQIEKFKMSRLHLSPAQLDDLMTFAEEEGRQKELSPIRYWFVGSGGHLGHFSMEIGEKFFTTYPPDAKSLLTVFYGCPEVLWAATWFTYGSLKEMQRYAVKGNVCMGTPLFNMWICIVDDKKWVDCPLGEKGEICISGSSWAAGECPVAEPKSKTGNENTVEDMKIFQTGDLGRIVNDRNGNRVLYLEGRTHSRIKRLFRNDVKVRGRTIDLLEVAEQLRKRNIVGDCVAFSAPRTKSEQTIVLAYIPVNDEGQEETQAHVKAVQRSIDVVIPVSNIHLLDDGQVDQKSMRREYHRYLTSCAGVNFKVLKPSASKLEMDTMKVLCKSIASSFGMTVKQLMKSFNDTFWQIGGNPARAVRTIFAARAQGFILTPEDILVSEDLNKLLDRMVFAKGRDPIWKKSVNEVRSQIKYEEMTKKHRKDVIRLLKLDYESSSNYEKYWKKVIDEILLCKLSVVALVDERVVGVALNCRTVPKLENVPSAVKQIQGMFNKVSDICRNEMTSVLGTKIGNLYYIAADEETLENDAWKVIVMRDLFEKSFEIAKKNGYGSFLACTANPLVQEVVSCLLNLQIFLELPMNRYKSKNFEKPFWDKNDEEKLGVYFKIFNNSTL